MKHRHCSACTFRPIFSLIIRISGQTPTRVPSRPMFMCRRALSSKTSRFEHVTGALLGAELRTLVETDAVGYHEGRRRRSRTRLGRIANAVIISLKIDAGDSSPILSSSAWEAVCAVVPNESADAPAPCGTAHGGRGHSGAEGGGWRVSAMSRGGAAKQSHANLTPC